MRSTFLIPFLVFLVSLFWVAPVEGKPGKGGGAGQSARGGFGSGQGGHGGGVKRAGQQHPHGSPVKDDFAKRKLNEKQSKKDLAEHTGKSPRENAKGSNGTTDGDSATGDPTDAHNKKLKQLAIEQRNRDKRIAQAQHLREIAERTGNQNLLANADRMEAFAHEHYARRVMQLEKFGVTDPTLTSGGGVIDPMLPSGEPAVGP